MLPRIRSNQMRAMAALIGGGVMESYPRLRVAFLEAGVGWLPFWMERLDEHFELMPEYVPVAQAQAVCRYALGELFYFL